MRFLNESTAAALAYGFGRRRADETVLVVDLGGGRLDASVMEIGDGMFDVKAASSDLELGGEEWTERLFGRLVAEFASAHGVDLNADPMAQQRVWEAAERAKLDLTQSQETQIQLPFVTVSDAGPLHLERTVSRAEFEVMTDDLVERCGHPIETAPRGAGIGAAALDRVLLVGGASRMPAVWRRVRAVTGRDPDLTVNPDEAVAIGAAIQAGVRTGEVRDVLVIDVMPLALGIETVAG